MRSPSLPIISALFLAEISVTFESTMLFAALPTLIREFGSPVTAGWLITLHMLVGATAGVLAGRLGDLQGRKRILLILLAVATLGSILSAVTSDFAIVLVGRVLQGLAIAVVPLTIGVLRESLPAEKVPVAVGLMTTSQGVGVALGLVLGGAIVDNFNWHWLFVASAVMLAISWVVVASLIPTRPGTPTREPINWIEGVLPAPGIMAMLYGISLSASRGWFDHQVWIWIASGAVVLLLWARISLRAKEPFIDIRLLGSRDMAFVNLIVILLALGTMNIVMVFSTYTQSPAWTMAGLGLSATVAGLAKLPSNALSWFAGPLSGLLSQKFGNRLPVLAGGLMAAAGWTVAVGLPGSLVEVILLLCIISFGTTILNAAIPNMVIACVPEGRTSEAIGTISVVRGMAAAIGAQIIATFLSVQALTAPGNAAQLPSPTGFQLTMGWIAVLTLAATAMGVMLKARKVFREGAAAAEI